MSFSYNLMCCFSLSLFVFDLAGALRGNLITIHMEDIPKETARNYLTTQFKEHRETLIKQKQSVIVHHIYLFIKIDFSHQLEDWNRVK
jgi:hypothetical protein